jgi:outer membrane lipoprotein-sorting protein
MMGKIPMQSSFIHLRNMVCMLAIVTLGTAAVAAPDAQAILAASDLIRNPGQPFKVMVTLTEFDKGVQVETSTLQSYSRTLDASGQFASLVRFVEPARDTGKLMLKNGNDLWFFDPGSNASVRLSPQQRLMGQASNGDVVTVNFAKSYQATLADEETIQDGERRTRKAYKLRLEASAPDVTYSAIELWVDTENSWPLKARFYAESGRLLKTAYYRRFQHQLGGQRPTETVIIDGLNSQSVTILRFTDYTARNIPVTWFQRDFLPRFQPE